MSQTPTTARRTASRWALRPAVPAASCFILGIFVHPYVPQQPLVWIALLTLAACAAVLTRRHAGVSCLCLALGLLSAGTGLAQVEASHYSANHISTFTGADAPRLAQLELRVDQPPRILTGAFGDGAGRSRRPLPPRQVASATVLAVRTWDGWQPAGGQVLMQVEPPYPQLAINQRIRVLAWLGRPAPAMNPGQFDWSGYYREQRILASVRIRRAENIQILEDPGPWPLDRLRQSVRQALAAGFTPQRSLDHALLRALLVGDSDPQLRDVQQQFVRTGTSHHLSISGLHIAVLGGFVYLLCRLLRLPPRRSAWIGMVFVILYGLVALPSPPVVRSVLLCVGLAMGLIQRRSRDAVQVLALSVLAMLIYHPLDVYSPGFQLSFLTVLGLMVMTKPLTELVQSWEDPHQKVADSFQPPRGLRAAWRWARWHCAQALIAGLVAWSVSMPLIAYHFQQLNPWAIPASIVLGAPVFLGLIFGLLKVVLSLLVPGLAPVWATAAGWPMICMRHTVDWLARLPGSDVPLGALPSVPVLSLGLVLLYFLLLCLPLLGQALPGSFRQWLAGRWVAARRALAVSEVWRKAVRLCPGWRGRLPSAGVDGAPAVAQAPSGQASTGTAPDPWQRWLRAGPLIAALSSLCLPLLPLALDRTAGDPVRLTVLAVGAGSCTVVEVPGHRAILIDCGSSSLTDAYRQCLEPFLRSRGIRRIEAIFLTHANVDHFSAAGAVLDGYDVSRVYTDPMFAVHGAGESARELLAKLDGVGRPATTLSRGERLALGGGAELEVLWPSPEEQIDENDASLVLRLTCQGHSVLFTGDIQATAESRLLREPERLRSDILIAPHHGSAEPTTAAFIRAVDPKHIISSDDATPTAKQRAFELLAGDRPLHHTHRCGAVTVTLGEGDEPDVRTFVAGGAFASPPG